MSDLLPLGYFTMPVGAFLSVIGAVVAGLLLGWWLTRDDRRYLRERKR
jgi:hypothetical protein